MKFKMWLFSDLVLWFFLQELYGDCDKFRQRVFQLATETEDNDSSLGKKSCNLSLMLMTCSRWSNLSIKRLSHDLGWSCAHVKPTNRTRMPCKKHSAGRVSKFSKHCGKNVCEILPKSNLLKCTYQETSCRPVMTSLMSLIPIRRLWKDRPSMERLNQHNKHNHQSDKVPFNCVSREVDVFVVLQHYSNNYAIWQCSFWHFQ